MVERYRTIVEADNEHEAIRQLGYDYYKHGMRTHHSTNVTCTYEDPAFAFSGPAAVDFTTKPESLKE